MYWLHLTKKQKKRITQVLSPAEIQDPFADQSESLHWTALMITGTAETALRSVIDATGLAETRSREFRDWLVLWAHLATCRTALNAIRSSIHETAKRYAGWACSHKNHEPLSWVEVRRLQDLDTGKVVAAARRFGSGCSGSSRLPPRFVRGLHLVAGCAASNCCGRLLYSA